MSESYMTAFCDPYPCGVCFRALRMDDAFVYDSACDSYVHRECHGTLETFRKIKSRMKQLDAFIHALGFGCRKLAERNVALGDTDSELPAGMVQFTRENAFHLTGEYSWPDELM